MPYETALESGYGPQTPPADNLCNDFVQESSRSFAVFAEARGDRLARADGFLTMTDAGSPVPFFNRAILEQPVDDLDRLLEQLRAFYSPGTGSTPFLLDSAWPTPDSARARIPADGTPPVDGAARSRATAGRAAGAPDRRGRERATRGDFEHTLAYGYPAPQLQPVTTATVLTTEGRTAKGWRHFVGYVDGGPVAAGSYYVDHQLVRVDNIATVQDVRGRGFGLAITAATIGVDLSKPATLVASDLGRPIYERLGFTAMLRVTYWIGSRTAAPG